MRPRSRALALLGALLAILACGGAAAPEADESSLKDSFAETIAAIDHVQGFAREGDEIRFEREDGAGDLIEWRVEIDEASVEPRDDDASPFLGHVRSTWYLDGMVVRITGDQSNLPGWILETGLAQDCYALWDSASSTWGW